MNGASWHPGRDGFGLVRPTLPQLDLWEFTFCLTVERVVGVSLYRHALPASAVEGRGPWNKTAS